MNPLLIGVATLVCSIGGILVGLWLRATLPRAQIEGDANDVIKLGIGLTASVTALVLGLVTASAKSSFDAVNDAVKVTSTKLLVLDRTLARYGPEAGPIRLELEHLVRERIEMVWPADSAVPLNLDPTTAGRARRAEAIVDAIRSLDSKGDLRGALQARAVGLAEEVLETRWTTMSGVGSSVPVVFLVVVVSWLTLIFATYGLFASTRTAVVVLFLCALSVAAALFLVLELDNPFEGLIKVPPDALRYALGHINR